jgi:hypothetical protein
MKISENTINILKNFSAINGNILVRPGNVLSTLHQSKTIQANATVEETFPLQFAIYELPKLLGVFSLFDDPEIEFGTNQLSIVSGNQTVNYTYTDPSMVISPDATKKLVIDPAEVSFSITQSEYQKIIRAASVLQVPNIIVVGDGSKIKVCAANAKNPTTNTFSIEVGDTDRIFSVVFRVENLIKLLPMNYDVKINFRGISSFVGTNIQYFISIEQNESRFNS